VDKFSFSSWCMGVDFEAYSYFGGHHFFRESVAVSGLFANINLLFTTSFIVFTGFFIRIAFLDEFGKRSAPASCHFA
jgi:hypothetical protein